MNLQDVKQFIIGNLIAGFLVQLLNQLPWNSIILYTLKKIAINKYYITDQNTVKRIQKRLSSKTDTTIDDKAYGCIWDYKLLAYIYNNDNNDLIISLYCSKDTYETLIAETVSENTSSENTSQEVVEVPKQKIIIYERSGTYYNTYYNKRNVYIHSINCRPNQCDIISEIVNIYKKKTHVVSLIHGPPNTGKSTIGLLLAKELKGTYCNSLKPWLPNCTLNTLYAYVQPDENKPLIVVMDEFDVPLLNLHNGLIKPNKDMSTSMIDKCGWNTFFDDIQRGIYPYVIIVLTTNKSPDFINELDKCYIRSGRVDLIHELV